MYYNYRTKDGKIIKCWFNDIARNEKENIFGTMEISKSHNKNLDISFHKKDEKEYKVMDLNNPYFIFEGYKIFFNDFICRTPQEFVNVLNNIREGKEDKQSISSEELCQILIKYGIDSLKISMFQKKADIIKTQFTNIFAVIKSHNDNKKDYNWIDYKFQTDWLRKPENCYKLYLVPLNEKDKHVYPNEDFYVTDLISMLRNKDNNYMILKVNDKKEQK